MIPELEKLSERINHFYLDVRAEVIAADLLEAGLTTDRFMIHNAGQHKRSYSKDLEETTFESSPNGRKKHLVFKLNRDGIYDGLPQSVFHQQQMQSSGISVSSMTKEYRQRKQEEKEARSFFAPFENEFFVQKTFIELIERNLFFQLNEDLLDCYGAEFLNVEDALPDNIVSKITSLLPYLPAIAGNLSLTAKCLSLLLNTPVTYKKKHTPSLPENFPGKALKEIKLGIDSTLGKNFQPDFPVLEFMIGPVEKDTVVHYINGGIYYNFLNNFYDFFIPFNLEVETLIKVSMNESGFKLSSKNEDARLGFTSVL